KDYYQQAREMSYSGHCFYSKDHVAEIWNEFYNFVLLDEKIKPPRKVKMKKVDQ
ncbi:MAG: hypothetical protein K0R90_1486, partial [Oscillospiraceae bacterium]|nr:hypothetical protein [Oscillospiraceae bacterium]